MAVIFLGHPGTAKTHRGHILESTGESHYLLEKEFHDLDLDYMLLKIESEAEDMRWEADVEERIPTELFGPE